MTFWSGGVAVASRALGEDMSRGVAATLADAWCALPPIVVLPRTPLVGAPLPGYDEGTHFTGKPPCSHGKLVHAQPKKPPFSHSTACCVQNMDLDSPQLCHTQGGGQPHLLQPLAPLPIHSPETHGHERHSHCNRTECDARHRTPAQHHAPLTPP